MTHRRVGIALVLLASLVATAVLTIAASASRSPAATIVGQGKASPRKSVCGLGTGKKATGKPVNIGAIVTVVPGLNWDEITDNAAAYYNCVNDNGGLNGRPINFIVHVEQINPEQVAAFAKKLIEEEKVVALAGTIDALDCAVNAKYYAEKKFYVIGDGVHDSCYGGTPYHAAINYGPAYSTLGAAQYLVRKGVKGTVVVVSPLGVDAAGTWNKPAIAFLKSKGIKGIDVHDPYPFQGPQQAQKYVQLAGKGGGVILDSTTSETLKVIKAAEAAGIANDVLWAASTPSNDTTFAKEAGKFWNGKFGVNAELTLLQGRGPGRDALPGRPRQVRRQVGQVELRSVRIPRREDCDRGPADDPAEQDHCEDRQRGVPQDQELAERSALRPVVLRQAPRAHSEPRGHDSRAEGRQDGAGRGLLQPRAHHQRAQGRLRGGEEARAHDREAVPAAPVGTIGGEEH